MITVTLSDDLIALLAEHGKWNDVIAGKSHLSVGLDDILLFEDNMSKLYRIKDGKLITL